MKTLPEYLHFYLEVPSAHALLHLFENNSAVKTMLDKFPDADVYYLLAQALCSCEPAKLPAINLNHGNEHLPAIKGD